MPSGPRHERSDSQSSAETTASTAPTATTATTATTVIAGGGSPALGAPSPAGGAFFPPARVAAHILAHGLVRAPRHPLPRRSGFRRFGVLV